MKINNWTITILAILICELLLVVKLPALSSYFSKSTIQKNNLAQSVSVEEKKQRFKKSIIQPSKKIFLKLQARYQKVKRESLKDPESKYLQHLRKKYKVDNNQDLLIAIKPHPISLTLSQAAMESAWGTSRFYNEANNVFGIWSFNKNEPRIAARKKRGDKTIWLKKYNSIEDSIEDYYKILATGRAYEEFRKEKMLVNDSLKLTIKLNKYSEKGDQYGKELNEIIEYNNFKELDIL